jgi:phosphoglycolate phosphatase
MSGNTFDLRLNAPDLIFDLDGTLIDSAPSILTCIKNTILAAGFEPVHPIDASLIGPPLMTALASITGLANEETLSSLAAAFKACYDEDGLRATLPCLGIPDVLRQLHKHGTRLHLATNKRMHPTRAILDMLGWNEWFTSVYTLDRDSPGHADKSAMLGHLLRENCIASADAAYVGDTREDAVAAASNGLHFIAADWGYGNFDNWPGVASWSRATSPADLLAVLR